jgi:Protein of unknown function (DUF3048).
MKKLWKTLFIFVFLAIVLAGCGKSEKTDVGNHSGISNTENGKKEKPYYFAPLTGLKSEKKPDHRPVAVMINNHPLARPQSGLEKADIIYEVLAEGGVTRFLAIFQSEMPEIFGPVRSARDYYIELAKGYDAFFVAHGFSPEAKRMLDSGYIDNINGIYYDGTLFQRSKERQAPHNSYMTYENLKKGAEKNGYSLKGMPEPLKFLQDGDEIDGTPATEVNIDYSTDSFFVRYVYDADTQTYARYSNNKKTVDEESGNPIALANIFIVEMSHSVIDEKGRLEINLDSGGKALLLQRGKVIEVEWENKEGKILPCLAGRQVPLVPGKTWINIVPDIEQMVNVETDS